MVKRAEAGENVSARGKSDKNEKIGRNNAWRGGRYTWDSLRASLIDLSEMPSPEEVVDIALEFDPGIVGGCLDKATRFLTAFRDLWGLKQHERARATATAKTVEPTNA